jgi:hypothetical protein
MISPVDHLLGLGVQLVDAAKEYPFDPEILSKTLMSEREPPVSDDRAAYGRRSRILKMRHIVDLED